jgi:hypothetical protein
MDLPNTNAMIPDLPMHEILELQRLQQLRNHFEFATLFSETDKLLNSQAHRSIRLSAAYNGSVAAVVGCGMGALGTRYLETALRVASEFAYLDEEMWQMKTAALENLHILSTTYESSVTWANYLREENPKAAMLEATPGRNQTRMNEGLSWVALQTAVAGGYITNMGRPGWAAAIVETLLSSDKRPSEGEWRKAIIVYMTAMQQLMGNAFTELTASGKTSTAKANQLVAFFSTNVRRVLDAYQLAFPGDRTHQKLSREFFDRLSGVPEAMKKMAGRASGEHDSGGGESSPDGFPPRWMHSAALAREVDRCGLKGARFRLRDARPAVDHQRSASPMACVALEFETAHLSGSVDANEVSFALRCVVWLSLAYAANRSQFCWAAALPSLEDEAFVKLGEGVPVRLVFIGINPTHQLHERICMSCVSDVVGRNWRVSIIPQFLNENQEGRHAEVNVALCKAFRPYLDVELVMHGGPILS